MAEPIPESTTETASRYRDAVWVVDSRPKEACVTWRIGGAH